jgi:hypothetical protein
MSSVLDPCEGSALLDAQWAKLIEASERSGVALLVDDEDLSGEDALQKLARLPHVDLSGYSEAADMPSDLLHLEKPFLQADLATTVARALSVPAAG